jgi:hypothetical protein
MSFEEFDGAYLWTCDKCGKEAIFDRWRQLCLWNRDKSYSWCTDAHTTLRLTDLSR